MRKAERAAARVAHESKQSQTVTGWIETRLAGIRNLQSRLRAEGKGSLTITHARRALGTALEAAMEAGLDRLEPHPGRSLRLRAPDKVEAC